MKVGECALEKTPTPVIVIKCLLLLGRMSPVLSRPCAAIQLLRAVRCSLPQWNFADHHHPLWPTLTMGVEFNSIQHPSIQFATPFNSPLEGGIVEVVHCPALCESTHILGAFWLYLQHRELCWPVLFACIIIIICVDKFSNPFNLCSTEHAADADDGRAEGRRRRLQDG